MVGARARGEGWYWELDLVETEAQICKMNQFWRWWHDNVRARDAADVVNGRGGRDGSRGLSAACQARSMLETWWAVSSPGHLLPAAPQHCWDPHPEPTSLQRGKEAMPHPGAEGSCGDRQTDPRGARLPAWPNPSGGDLVTKSWRKACEHG